MVGGEGDDQLWGSGCGAIAGCHCSVLWLGVRVTTKCGGVGVVPLLGAIGGCHCSVLWLGGGIFSLHMTTQKLFFAIWGLCWSNFFKILGLFCSL